MLTFTWWYLVEFCNFYPRLILETIFPVLTLTQRNYTNMKIYFLENWQLNRKLASPLLPLKDCPPLPLAISPGRRSSQSDKFESKQNWKIPLAHSLLWAEKNESSTRATFTNPSFQSFCVRKNFKVQPKIHI